MTTEEIVSNYHIVPTPELEGSSTFAFYNKTFFADRSVNELGPIMGGYPQYFTITIDLKLMRVSDVYAERY